jgi:RNA polymerase sigma-70 factor (ECF subfamily)
MYPISDDDIRRASRGDVEAFERIYRASSSFVYNLAYRIINNKEEAEEITQDVFLKIHGALKAFRFQSSFKTWVYRIAVNAALNTYRRRVKEMKRREDDFDTVLKNTGVPEAARACLDREAGDAQVASLLNGLNPDQRACIVLRELEGLSYQDIARALDINVNTVRSRLKRARLALFDRSQKEVIKNGM